MWNKVYLIAAAFFLLVMSVLTYISCGWLESITKPADVAQQYISNSNISWYFLIISSLILLILANVILWTAQKAWAFWTTLLYFVVFIVLQTFWLDNSFVQYLKDNGLAPGTYTLRPLLGAVLCIVAAILVFFNQIVVLRMYEKMYAKEEPAESISEDELPAEETKPEN
jgi:heme/copper-type cytochrome/quinol oxidase subunit 2